MAIAWQGARSTTFSRSFEFQRNHAEDRNCRCRPGRSRACRLASPEWICRKRNPRWRRDRSSYQRPPLSKDFLKGDGRNPLLLKGEVVFARDAIDLKRGRRVLAIDRGAKTVRLDDGASLSYDHLALAMGARHGRPDSWSRTLRSSRAPRPRGYAPHPGKTAVAEAACHHRRRLYRLESRLACARRKSPSRLWR